MAVNSFQLFLGQIQTAPEVLRVRVLQIVFDILMVHEADFLEKEKDVGNNNFDIIATLTLLQRERVVEIFLRVLQNEESDKVQALLCIGLAKLVLAGMICDDKVGTNKLLHDVRR